MEKVENIFFEQIIKEASIGNIDCDFLIPICFGTRELINNQYKDLTVARDYEDTLIPTLLIKDRKKVIESVYEYVRVAQEFYSGDRRLEDVSNKEKYIIASLLANALVTDFNDIDNLFDRHTQFILNDTMKDFLEPVDLGYSSVLKSNIIAQVNKQSIIQESPYALDIWLEDNDKHVIYNFPTIRFGIDKNKAYIYAIQNNKNDIKDKKIERVLRKVGEGFDEKDADRDPIESPENLYSVSPWALVALAIAIPLIKNNSNVDEFVAPYFLINRWNAKEISYNIIKEKYGEDDRNVQLKKEQILKQDEVQRNITDKFIRTFRRIEHHFSNIYIPSFQLENDSCLHVQVGEEYNCNNALLNEVSTLANNYSNNKKRL